MFLEPVRGDKGVANVDPHLLPSGASSGALLFSAGLRESKDVYLWNRTSGRSEMLVEGANPVFAPQGFIVYQPEALQPDLWALPFSLNELRVTGEASPIAQGVGNASLSIDGTLLSVDVGGLEGKQLVWRDRTGRMVGQIGRPQQFIRYPSLSPDGMLVAVTGHDGGGREVWLHEAGRSVAQRVTTDGGSPSWVGWSPDGKFLTYSSRSDQDRHLFIQRADGSSGPELLAPAVKLGNASDWSQDGRRIIFTVSSQETENDLWILDREANGGTGDASPFLATQFNEQSSQFSPDGKFVAYCSDESGAVVYVRDFPSALNRRQVYEAGGCQPRWSHDGSELLYVEGNTLIAVSVTLSPEFRIGKTTRLFSDTNLSRIVWDYDVSPDGRFVLIEDVANETAQQRKPSIHVTQNWYEEFRDRE